MTTSEMEDLAEKATDVAIAFGRATQEYLAAVTEFSRAGYGQTAQDLAELSLLLQNVGDMSGRMANQMLLAVDASYKLGGSQEELEDVVDKVNMVANNNATSIAKMAEGISISASIMNQAGVSIEEFIALVGTATSVTQRSGSEIARGLRTSILRLQGVTNAELDVTAESISKAEEVLNKYGIAVRDDFQKLRAPFEVFKDISEKFREELKENEVAQSEIIQRVAGKKQANVLSSIVNNWEMVDKQIGETMEASGSAMRENERYMESWEAKSKQLSAAVTQMWQTTLSTDAIKTFIDGVRSVVEWITKVGGLIPLISGLISYLFVSAILKGTIAISGMIKGLKALNTALTLANIKAAGLPILFGLLTTTVISFMMRTKDAKEEVDEFNNAITLQTRSHKELNQELEQSAKSSAEHNKQESGKLALAERLVGKLYEMSDAYVDSEVEMKRMFKIKNEIYKLIPSLNIEIDKETGKITTQKEAIDKLIESQRASLMVEAARQKMIGTAQIAFEAQTNIYESKAKLGRVSSDIEAKGLPLGFNNLQAEISKRLSDGVTVGEGQQLFSIMSDAENNKDLLLDIEENEKILKEANDRLADFEKISQDFESKIIKSKTTKTTDSLLTVDGNGTNKSRFISPTESIARGITLQSRQNKDAEELLQKEISRAKSAEDYTLAIELQNKLLSHQKKSIKELESSQEKLSSEADKVRAETKLDTTKWFLPTGETNEFYNNLFNSLGADGQDAIESIKDRLQILGNTWRDQQEEIENYKDSILEIPDSIKELVESQEKLYKEQVAAVETTELKIQDIIKEGVKKKKEALKDELDKLKEITDKKIAEREREWASDDLKKQREKETKNVQELQNKINALSRDTSLAGIAERKELEKELAEELESIEENREDARRDLIRNTLKDTVSFREDAVDKEIKEIDKVWNHEVVTLKASEVMRKQSFESLKTEFPELFDELRVSADNFFGVFESYESIVVGSTTTMNTKLKDLISTLKKATDASAKLFAGQDKLKQQSNDKMLIGMAQRRFNELDSQGHKMENNAEMRELHQLAQGIRDKNKWEHQDLSGYKGTLGSFSQGINAGLATGTGGYQLHGSKSNPEWVLTTSQMYNVIKNLANNTLGSIAPRPSMAGGDGMNLNIVVNGSPDSGVVSGIRQAGSDLAKQFKDILKKKGS